MDQLNLNAWIDRGTTLIGGVTDQSAASAHAVLGQPETFAPTAGETLPPLWHWFAFNPTASTEELGEDGHTKLGDFMPPLRAKRRVWAGGRLEFVKPLHVGEELRQQTTIADISQEQGAAGEIIVISLDHCIHGDQGLAVIERQNIVYLDNTENDHAPNKIEAPMLADINEGVGVSTPMLMRYSAITINAHPIHYDLPYTQKVEHCPDLLVHGPLQANLLMDMAFRHRGHAPSLFSYRSVHPLFASDGLSLQALKSSENEWSLRTVAGGAHQCMQANAVWEV